MEADFLASTQKNIHAKHKAIENFWLCANCAKSFTLHQVEGKVELRLRDRKTA